MAASSVKPASAEVSRRLALRAVLGGSFGAFLAACGSSWWTTITQNPGSVLQFIQYVEAFLQAVAAVWGVIFPLIPAAAQAQAQSDYSNAVFTIEQAVQAIEDALKAAAAASQPVPDLSKLIAAVQAAVDALMKIIGAWQGGSAAGDAGTTAQASPRGATPAQIAELQRQQTVIHSWK